MDSREILVFPRKFIQDFYRFIPSARLSQFLSALETSVNWLPREEAEQSQKWVQPIPCSLIRSHDWQYCVLRRVRQTRADLSEKISLVAGGHVDKEPAYESISSLLLRTLQRELYEELGIRYVSNITLLGLVIDPSSVLSSRHIAFVHEVVATEKFSARASEEFSLRSKLTGRFFTPDELSRFHTAFDPWSGVLFEDYIAPFCTSRLPGRVVG